MCSLAEQVGRGLAYLHHCGIAHGALTSSNIVLRTSNEDRRGFTAKIGAPRPHMISTLQACQTPTLFAGH